MERSKIQQVFDFAFPHFFREHFLFPEQLKAANAIMNCKSGKLGCNISICDECGHTHIHNNSCRNRNCPNCQAVLKEVWIDQRKSEVIDSSYFHVVFTVPEQLNALILANQKTLYSLLHQCSSETLLELCENPEELGFTPGFIQVLHTWGQELNFHPHIHCIVSGGGLTRDKKLKKCKKSYLLPLEKIAPKFKGKFLSYLKKLYMQKGLIIPSSCEELKAKYLWMQFMDKLYDIQWCPYIKETFNGFGNAIEYLGRYTHRIAITNTRIQSVTSDSVTFSAKDYKTGEMKNVTLGNEEFIQRLLMHVLPKGFQKIRYYGFLNNRSKKKNLRLIFRQQGYQQFRSMLSGLKMDEILKTVWGYDIHRCPCCGKSSMRPVAKMHYLRY